MERIRGKVATFTNDNCSFVPVLWEKDEGVLKPVLLKVVTSDLLSLGLRKNPNIMRFEIGSWVRLPENEIVAGNSDWGGIWSALKLSGARTLANYMADKYNRQTRIFLTVVDNPLFANSYRVKSQGVFLLEELKR